MLQRKPPLVHLRHFTSAIQKPTDAGSTKSDRSQRLIRMLEAPEVALSIPIGFKRVGKLWDTCRFETYHRAALAGRCQVKEALSVHGQLHI